METGWGGAGMFDGWNGDWGWEFDGDQGLTPIEMAPVDFAFGPLGGSTDWSSWYGSFDDAGSSESGIMAEPPAPTPPVATPPPAVAAPAAVTLDTLEWPANAPFGHETEKSYELRTVTTTLTSGFDAYTLGMTAEATYLTDSSTFDGAAVVKGGGSVKFTFQKVTAGTPATPPDPIWDTWLVDTSAAATAPVPAPIATATPFASLLPAATTKWDKIEVAEHVTRLAHGLHNDRSVEYWYAAEDISNTRTVITPGATTADGVSAATVRISGDYSTRYGAGDWEAHANSVRQGTLWADNRSSGTFAQNQTVSTTFANGIAISQSVVGDGRLDGTRPDQGHSAELQRQKDRRFQQPLRPSGSRDRHVGRHHGPERDRSQAGAGRGKRRVDRRRRHPIELFGAQEDHRAGQSEGPRRLPKIPPRCRGRIAVLYDHDE